MKRTKDWYIKLLIFFIYLAFLCYFLFFAEAMGRTGASSEYRYNLVPFNEIIRYVRFAGSIGFSAVFLNLEGNILAFIPFGFFLPELFIAKPKMWKTILGTACFSACVELIQLLSKVGSCDVDDVILNTLGGVFGYLLFLLIGQLKKKKQKQ